MKKTIAVLMMLCVSVVLSAAGQFDVSWGGVFVNQNLSLSIHVTSNNLFKNYDTFGFYAKNADGTFRYESFDTASAAGKKFDLGDFAAGENVGFYVKKGDTILDHFGLVEKGNGKYQMDAWSSDWSRYDQFEIQIIPGDYSGDGNLPSGQPLPGVLAAVALGGAFLWTRRKKSDR